jgi:uncharacterized membrane protein
MSRGRTIALSISLGAAAAILMAGTALADDGHGFGGRFRDHERGGRFIMILPILLLIAVAAALLIVLWRGRHPTLASVGGAPPVSPTFNAETILADRLARGEISPDDYRAAVTVLRETPPPGS